MGKKQTTNAKSSDELLYKIDKILGKGNYFIDYGMALDIYGLLPMAYGDLVDVVVPVETEQHKIDKIMIKLKKGLKRHAGFTVALSGESKKINDGLICGTVVVIHKRKFRDDDYVRVTYDNLKLNLAKPEKCLIDCLARDDFYRNEVGIPSLIEGLEFGNINQDELLKIARSERIYTYVRQLIKDIKQGKFVENAA
ncbi:MAG: hypothetical protein CVU81_02330 [Euryarchaeota archaeon HGW-Euryarchaeota-1]|nr:MAG: hypothetical protein CVU81_02330 [Euryarchaeota archaeon HGW-Euryarchaeota-1]